MTRHQPIETPPDRAEIGVATITGQAAGVLHRMSTPKERPIHFSAPMVRAILAGTKTQTRRIVKGDPAWSVAPLEFSNCPGWWAPNESEDARRCHFGVPGDRLWVRESFSFGKGWDGTPPAEVTRGEQVFYADGTTVGGRQLPSSFGRVRSSIHMPRWASRITLEVVSVGVERLHAISFADCRAEGCNPDYSEQVAPCAVCDGNDPCTGRHVGEKWHFTRLWESIHGPGSWELNPWVWKVTFRRIDQ